MIVNTDAALEFLRTAYEPDDWIALFFKSYVTGRCTQRVGPLSLFLERRMHAWLRAMNAQRFNVYVSVNAIRPGARTRTKAAIGAIRHVFVEADEDARGAISKIEARSDVPKPSYLIHSSPGRVHVLWRAVAFTGERVELLQKHLAAEFDTDPAATPCSQTTRLPGYVNHKYLRGHLVSVDYRDIDQRHLPSAFPAPPPLRRSIANCVHTKVRTQSGDLIERARRYLARVEPAIAGEHGDLHTFKVCCRIVRGFALCGPEALLALSEWNQRCQPPWREQDLRDNVARAARYGREAIGSML